MSKLPRVPKAFEESHLCDNCKDFAPLFDFLYAKWCSKCVSEVGSFNAAAKMIEQEWIDTMEERREAQRIQNAKKNATNLKKMVDTYGFDPFDKDVPYTTLTLTPNVISGIMSDGLYEGREPFSYVKEGGETVTIDW